MVFGILKDIKEGENRVICTPVEVASIRAAGHTVLVQSGAGVGSGFSDEKYAAAGAEIVAEAAEMWQRCDFLAKVKEIEPSEFGLPREGQMLYCCVHPAGHPEEVDALLKSKCIAITAEDSHRYGSPNCEAAGKQGALFGLESMLTINGGKGKFVGGFAGAPGMNVLILGGGTVGQGALSVLYALGANVTVMDINVGILRQLGDKYQGHINTMFCNQQTIASVLPQTDMVINCVKWPKQRKDFLITKEMLKLMEPGSVLVDISKDVTAAVCEFTSKKPEPIRTVTTFNEEQVKWAAEIINGAQRPLVYFGGGVRSAASCQPLRDLLKKAEIPATHTLMAAGVVPYGDPMNIGMVGMHGCYTSNRAVADCDVLIAVGTRFSDRVALNPKTFAKNATIIQIDIDASELGKNVDVDLSIVGDAAYVLNAMLPLVEEKKHPDWMKMIHEWQAQDYHPVSDASRLMPHQVIGEVCNQCGPEAVYVTDVGQHQMWAAQYIRHAKSRGFITSGGLGTMGFGYGAAIGAQMALGRDQRVVMFTGDGSFHMNLNEACTAVSYELPIITVIFNNSVLGMVRQWQTTFYGKRYSQTDPHRKTNFVKLAEGFGLKGYHCENLAQFQEAFADALKQKGPTWIECMIDKDEKVLPMIPGGGDINDIIMK